MQQKSTIKKIIRTERQNNECIYQSKVISIYWWSCSGGCRSCYVKVFWRTQSSSECFSSRHKVTDCIKENFQSIKEGAEDLACEAREQAKLEAEQEDRRATSEERIRKEVEAEFEKEEKALEAKAAKEEAAVSKTASKKTIAKKQQEKNFNQKNRCQGIKFSRVKFKSGLCAHFHALLGYLR